MHSQILAASPRQRGVSTLVVAIVLLIAATFLTFFAAKVGMQEQRMSANDYRHKEAFSTAEAGLDRAKAYLAANRQAFTGWPWTACAAVATPPCGDGAANLFGTDWSWVNVTTLDPTALDGITWNTADGPFILTRNTADSFQPVVLTSAARSADGTGRAVVRQSVSRYQIARPGPVPPMMAPTVGLGGNFTVVGNPNHTLDIVNPDSGVTLANCDDLTGGSGQMISIWSPNSVSLSGSQQTCHAGSYRDPDSNARCIGPGILVGGVPTEIPDPTTGETPDQNQCACETNVHGDVEKSPYSSSGDVNDDVVQNDPNFPGDMFLYTFGRDKDAVKATAASLNHVLPDCSTLNQNSTGLYWITGPMCNISGGTIGLRATPVILVFEQDARMQGGGSADLWGMIVGADMERTCTGGSTPYYVGGTCTSPSPNHLEIQGTFTVHGATIVEGTVDGHGTYNVQYDPCVFAAMGAGTSFDQYGPIAGSWNDVLR